jgi:hypothetical protein
LWSGDPNAIKDAIGYAMHYSRSANAVIRVYDEAWQRDRNARAQGRFQRTLTHETKSRHTVKRDG